MFELQLTPRVIHNAVPTSPFVRFLLAIINDTQGHQFMIVVAERVDSDNRVVTVGTILEKLLAEGDNGLMTMGFLAGKFISAIMSEEAGKLFLVYSRSPSSFTVPIHLVPCHLPFLCWL